MGSLAHNCFGQCQRIGSPIAALGSNSSSQTLFEGMHVNHRFSCKPAEGYADYHAKMTSYVRIISAHATAVESESNPRPYKLVLGQEEETVFLYTDSASSRAGIADLSKKLTKEKVAIVGLGGTGAYVLDLLVARNFNKYL